MEVKKLDKEKIVEFALKYLALEYPNAGCTLDYFHPYELLIATRLAAQCTDKRVNLVTKKLFKIYPTLGSFASSNFEDIENLIRPCGFYRIKAKDIINMCKMLIENFGSTVPDTMEQLLLLPGVGRKTANLILGDIYKKSAIVVDTHCIRVTRRLGLHNSKNPLIIENVLKKLLPPKESNDFCHRLVMHGRAVCKALRPKCKNCCLSGFCEKN